MLGMVRTTAGFRGVAALASGLAISAVAQTVPLRRIWWAAILLLGTSVSAVGWTIWQLRTDAIRAAISDSGNIAAVLASQLSGSLQSIDAVLLEIKKSSKDLDTERSSDFGAAFNRKGLHESLTDYLARMPQIFNIAIANADGQVVVSTAAWPTPNVNVRDRDYFNDARARADGKLSISIPINNRINGKQTIVFARRLEGASGNFVGIVYAGVNSKYFEDIYGSIQSVNNLIFTLVRPDGTILFRHPDGQEFMGKKLSGESTWLDALSRGATSYRIFAQSDGKVRFVSVRGVPEYPLFVNISVTEDSVLAGWRRRSATIGLGSAALLLCSLYLLIAVTRQVRRLSSSEASLMQTSQQLDAALNNMVQGLVMFDGEQRLIVCNGQYAKMYHLTPEQTKPGTPLRAILEAREAGGSTPDKADYVTDVLEKRSRRNSHSTLDTLRDGRMVSVTHQPMNNGGWVSIHQDITSQKHVEAELAHMAHYDALTGLANRALFLEKANEALERMRRLGERFSILMLDLDRFKAVNDSLGHAIGDSLLKAVAGRLLENVRGGDHVARLGGDEFAILQTVKKDQKDEAIVLANRILETITEPYDFGGRKVVIGTSIGITSAPNDGSDADALTRNADLALYKAKSQGRNGYRFFEASMAAEARERQELEEDIRMAMARHEFELHYQTIVDVGRQECCGAEALVRWRHPKRGLIAPGEFIARAEECGLIIPLGEWILRTACADAVKWPPHLKVAVNLSPAQFKQGNLLDILRSALADSELAPKRLEVEITETVLLEKTEENLAVLHELKTLGVSVVLDDFGIGYSSMRYLQMFPFDKIKIDKSFIQSMTSHADSAAIVCAIAGLGRNLDIETTAEGVETAEQLVSVRGAGCQLAQGYLFSRPVPIAQLTFERPAAVRDGARAA
jgi:diguanylate cyclase (GGDEF)-like protein